MTRTGIEGPNHALLTGELVGLMVKAGWKVDVLVVDEDYTNRIRVWRPSGSWLVTVTPEGVVEL